MRAPNWLFGADRRRVAVEVGLTVFALTLPLAAILQPALDPGPTLTGVPTIQSRWAAIGVGLAYLGYFGALLGAARYRRTSKGERRRLSHELSGAAVLVLAVWAGGLLANLAGTSWTIVSGPSERVSQLGIVLRSPLLAGESAVASILAYPLCRGVMLVLPLWDRLRRTRLLWALTHAQLIGSLALAAGVAVFSMASISTNRFGSPTGVEVLPDDSSFAAVLLVWLTTRLLPALTEFLVFGVAAGSVLLPLTALSSYLILRRTTRRLEKLTIATAAVRAGDLSARVPIGSEDEVGRLQADFNAMAADLERTLLDLQAERDRANGLLEDRRQLIVNVSHELRTPVATVRGYLEAMLQTGRPLPGKMRSDLETMQQEVTRLQRLIEDLFTLSRAEVGRLDCRIEPTDVGVVARRLIETMAPLGWQQRRVQVLAEVPPDLPSARADAKWLEQVMSNLLGNAVHHTPPGGLVATMLNAEPDAIRIEVRDTGEGIPPDDLTHIFERFYRGSSTGDERRDGAGLGLALVKELVEAMGCSVEVASTPGEGSCFTVRLPRA